MAPATSPDPVPKAFFEVGHWCESGKNMFRTMREAELMSGLIRPTSGLQFWSMVELETVWPWFHVETIDCTRHNHHRGIVLAPNTQVLKDLINGVSESAWITQVQVITPGSLNGSDHWKMEILSNLREVVDTSGKVSGHEYQVATGDIYSTVIGKDLNSISKSIYTLD